MCRRGGMRPLVPRPTLRERHLVFTSVTSLPNSSMWLYHDSDQQKGPPKPERSVPHPAIIISSAAHSTFCSQVRHRPTSDHISTRDQKEPPRVFGINLVLKAMPVLAQSQPARLGHVCGCVRPMGFSNPHEPAHSRGRHTTQGMNTHPQCHSTNSVKGQFATWLASG